MSISHAFALLSLLTHAEGAAEREALRRTREHPPTWNAWDDRPIPESPRERERRVRAEEAMSAAEAKRQRRREKRVRAKAREEGQ